MPIQRDSGKESGNIESRTEKLKKAAKNLGKFIAIVGIAGLFVDQFATAAHIQLPFGAPGNAAFSYIVGIFGIEKFKDLFKKFTRKDEKFSETQLKQQVETISGVFQKEFEELGFASDENLQDIQNSIRELSDQLSQVLSDAKRDGSLTDRDSLEAAESIQTLLGSIQSIDISNSEKLDGIGSQISNLEKEVVQSNSDITSALDRLETTTTATREEVSKIHSKVESINFNLGSAQDSERDFDNVVQQSPLIQGLLSKISDIEERAKQRQWSEEEAAERAQWEEKRREWLQEKDRENKEREEKSKSKGIAGLFGKRDVSVKEAHVSAKIGGNYYSDQDFEQDYEKRESGTSHTGRSMFRRLLKSPRHFRFEISSAEQDEITKLNLQICEELYSQGELMIAYERLRQVAPIRMEKTKEEWDKEYRAEEEVEDVNKTSKSNESELMARQYIAAILLHKGFNDLAYQELGDSIDWGDFVEMFDDNGIFRPSLTKKEAQKSSHRNRF